MFLTAYIIIYANYGFVKNYSQSLRISLHCAEFIILFRWLYFKYWFKYIKKKKIIDKYTEVLLSSSIKLVYTAVNDSSACISL